MVPDSIVLSIFILSYQCKLTLKFLSMFSVYPVTLLALVTPALAHEHGDMTDEQAHAPVDSVLWIHIFLQAAVWGVLFPTGMVLGITRSRWHVPVQVSMTHTECTPVPFKIHSVHRRRIDSCRLYTWSLTWRADVSPICTRILCINSFRTNCCATSTRDIFKDARP